MKVLKNSIQEDSRQRRELVGGRPAGDSDTKKAAYIQQLTYVDLPDDSDELKLMLAAETGNEYLIEGWWYCTDDWGCWFFEGDEACRVPEDVTVMVEHEDDDHQTDWVWHISNDDDRFGDSPIAAGRCLYALWAMREAKDAFRKITEEK